MKYQYWIIRFVPNVARGEFTNIGIVCGRDGGDWAAAFDLRSVRRHGNFSSDLHELHGWVTWFTRALDAPRSDSRREQAASSGWVEHLRSRQANSIQFAEPSVIDTGAAREGVNLLFPHLVEREHVSRRRGYTRPRLRSEVRDALSFAANLTLGRDLFLNPKIQIGKQRGSFDFLTRGGPEDAVTNVWAFNLATLDVLERDVQSWNYLIGRFRNDGASVSLGSKIKSIQLPSDSPIDVVYDPPASGKETRRGDIFEAAMEAWEIGEVKARSIDAFLSDTDFAPGDRTLDATNDSMAMPSNQASL